METLSLVKAHDGHQGVYKHRSHSTKTDMTFAVFTPPQARSGKVPVVWYLSGLTCTHANVMDKGEYRRVCAELGLMLVAPDTSPRGDDVPDDRDGAIDFGLGAGFYVDASVNPYAQHYQMWSYITEELPLLVAQNFAADVTHQSIMGHSMGGHGALVAGLRHPDRYTAASAFAPIVAPSQVPWGQKALKGYLGESSQSWRKFDSVALIEDGARAGDLLVDQGDSDSFLHSQLQPEKLKEVCQAANQPLTLNYRAGYDHSYSFVSSFMESHLRWHKEHLAS